MTAAPAPPPPGSPERAEQLDLYKAAIEEYRFQAQFNWSRTQYWLVFNTAILTAGVALLGAFDEHAFPIIVFAVGVVACALSAQALRVSHSYYRAARTRVRRFEDHLAIADELRLDTTPGLRARPSTPVNVTAVSYLLLAVIAVADSAGIITAALT